MSDRARSRVAESVYDMLHLEMVNYIQAQHAPSVYIANGMDAESAAIMSDSVITSKLEAMGAQTGARLVEKLSMDQGYLHTDSLVAVKFLCKDFWISVFGKQVDKLQANYRGMYVLHEAGFRWMQRIPCTDKDNYDALARPHVCVALGFVRGAIAGLGLPMDVRLEFDTSGPKPTCLFVITNRAEVAEAAAAAAAAEAQAAAAAAAGGPVSARRRQNSRGT